MQGRGAKVIQLITGEKDARAPADEGAASMRAPAARTKRGAAALLANTLLIGGSVAVSALPKVALTHHVFLMFLIGHAIWTVVAVKQQDGYLITLNVGMLLLDLYAIAIRL